MTRVGPNQDINNPESILEINWIYNDFSIRRGNVVAQSQAKDPDVSGPPIPSDVSIPFKLLDGSTKLLHGSNIDRVVVPEVGVFYIADNDLIGSGTLVTYIGLAERFRDYWEELNNAIGDIEDYVHLKVIDVDPQSNEGLGTGSLGGQRYLLTKVVHVGGPGIIRQIPEWEGVGPTDYNEITFQQLLDELPIIAVTPVFLRTFWETIYRWEKTTLLVRFGQLSGGSTRFVQFHNLGPGTVEIDLSISITASYAGEFETELNSWAEISVVNNFPTGSIPSLPSYESDTASDSGGGIISRNVSRTVVIPSERSAFIGLEAKVRNLESSVGGFSAVLILNGQELTHSVTP